MIAHYFFTKIQIILWDDCAYKYKKEASKISYVDELIFAKKIKFSVLIKEIHSHFRKKGLKRIFIIPNEIAEKKVDFHFNPSVDLKNKIYIIEALERSLKYSVKIKSTFKGDDVLVVRVCKKRK